MGNMVDCWYDLSSDEFSDFPRLSDGECRTEEWLSSINGQQMDKHGGNCAVAVYIYSAPPAELPFDIQYSACTDACSATGNRFAFSVEAATLSECAQHANTAGSDSFGVKSPGEPLYPSQASVMSLGMLRPSSSCAPHLLSDTATAPPSLPTPERYPGYRLQCWFGDDASAAGASYKPDSDCQAEGWTARVNGVEQTFTGGDCRMAEYLIVNGGQQAPDPNLPRPLEYVGCFVDCGVSDPRAFDTKRPHKTLEQCLAEARSGGHRLLAMQYPEGSGTDGLAECFYGDLGKLGDGELLQVEDSECEVEPFTSALEGHEYRYLGAGCRNAVYRLNDPVPVPLRVRYRGCYVDQSSRTFATVAGKRTLRLCAEAAQAAGHTIFGMQYPQGASQQGEAGCWFGGQGLAGNPVKKPDSECRVESWASELNGDYYPFHGSGWRNAVYEVLTGEPQELPFAATYLGCHKDQSTRMFHHVSSNVTPIECAAIAYANGQTRFGLQHPGQSQPPHPSPFLCLPFDSHFDGVLAAGRLAGLTGVCANCRGLQRREHRVLVRR